MRPWRNRRLITILIALIWLIIIIFYMNILKTTQDPQNEPMELLWWTGDLPWNYDETRFCGLAACRFTNKRERLLEARAILFYASNMKPHDFPLPRRSTHLWALLHEESPRNVPYVPHEQFLQHFNYTSTFSRNSDLPLTTQYLPSINDISNLDYFLTFEQKNIYSFNRRLAPVVFLQTDCDTMSGREDYVRELMQHIMVDSYGGCLKNRDLPKNLQKDYLNNLYSPELLRFLAPYKFMIAIENAVCEDYITEKFWRPLISGVIPIYFGSPTIRDWQPHNNSAIYVTDFSNAAALGKYLEELGTNATAYNAYLGHKLTRHHVIQNPLLLNVLATRKFSANIGSSNSEDTLFQKFECFMCKNMVQRYFKTPSRQANKRQYNCPYPPVYAPLQHKKEPKYASDWRSMMVVGRCQAKLLDILLRSNKSYTQATFESRLSSMVAKNLCN